MATIKSLTWSVCLRKSIIKHTEDGEVNGCLDSMVVIRKEGIASISRKCLFKKKRKKETTTDLAVWTQQQVGGIKTGSE